MDTYFATNRGSTVYQKIGDYETKEAAIAAAKNELGVEDGGELWICIGKRYRASDFFPDGDGMIEAMREYAYEIVVDDSEYWLYKVDDTQIDELTKELHAVLQRWIDKHGFEPDFYNLLESERVGIKERS